MPRFVAAVCFVGYFALPALAAPVPKALSLSAETKKAWEDIGAKFYWIESDVPFGRWLRNLFLEQLPSEKLPKGVKSPKLIVSFLDFKGSLKKLPPIECPFILSITQSEPEFGWFDELSSSNNLIGLIQFNLHPKDTEIAKLTRFPNLEEIRIYTRIEITEGDISVLTRLPALKKLSIGNNATFAANAFAELGKLNKLTDLDLNLAKIGDDDIAAIKGMTSLRRLNLDDTAVTNAGLQYLKGFTELYSLDLDHTHIGDAGLQYIVNLKSLRELSLTKTEVTNAGLADLKTMNELTVLELPSGISDAGLKHLKHLKNLKRLSAFDSKFANPGMEDLAGLDHLENLDLQDVEVPDDVLKEFAKRRPKVKIELTLPGRK
jgi:Leucine-rich repeat (LRR) protein